MMRLPGLWSPVNRRSRRAPRQDIIRSRPRQPGASLPYHSDAPRAPLLVVVARVVFIRAVVIVVAVSGGGVGARAFRPLAHADLGRFEQLLVDLLAGQLHAVADPDAVP